MIRKYHRFNLFDVSITQKYKAESNILQYFGSVFSIFFKLQQRGVMVKAMDWGIVVSEFIPQSCYYVHFRANTLGKGMNPLVLPAMG